MKSSVALLTLLLAGCATQPKVVEVLVPCVKAVPQRGYVAAPAKDAPVEVKARQLAVYAEEADKHIVALESIARVCVAAGSSRP